MTKSQILRYLRNNKDLVSIRAIEQKTGFTNLHKVINRQIDNNGHAFTFPDKHVKKVLKQVKRLQVKDLG